MAVAAVYFAFKDPLLVVMKSDHTEANLLAGLASLAFSVGAGLCFVATAIALPCKRLPTH